MQPSEPSRSLLSDTQRKLVAFALSFSSVALIIVLLVACFLSFSKLVSHFSNVLWPVATAGIIALILRPCIDYLHNTLRLQRMTSVILLFATFLLLVTAVLGLIVPPLVGQVVDFFSYVPTLWSRAVTYSQVHYPEWQDFINRHMENATVRQVVDSIAGESQQLLSQAIPSLKAAGGGIVSLFSFVTQLLIVPVYLFFFLLSSKESSGGLAEQLSFLKPSLRDDIVFLAREFVQIIVSFFRGQLLIGVIMGVLLSIGFSAVGLKFGLFLGLACGLLNVIPYLGTTIGLITTLPLAFLQPDGGWTLVALVLMVKLIVQTFEGWFLTPRIMGQRTGLHPAAIIFALFFWGTALDGILGMVLAIPLSAFFVTAWRLAKHKYITVH